MRSCRGTAAAVAVAGLLASPLGAQPAWAHAERPSADSAIASPRASALTPRVPGEIVAGRAPQLFSSVAISDDAAAAPWSIGRRIGLGMMLAAPLLATGGLYYRGRATTAAGSPTQTPCGDACRARDNLMSERARPQGEAAQWVLLSAGVATFAGGGLLFWLDGPKAARDSGPHAALRFGRNGLPTAVLLGKF
jgi:hypothetical protein